MKATATVMPKSCCVILYTTNKLKNLDLSVYLLPSEATEPEGLLWLQAIQREDKDGELWSTASDYHYVSSRYFIDGMH